MLRYDRSSKGAAVKVYVVSHCSTWNDDQDVDRVFTDEQKARKYCKDKGGDYFYDIMDLE